jgi:hypothetical protein
MQTMICLTMLQTPPKPEPVPTLSFVSPHVIGDRPEVLSRISDTDVNLCLWQRHGQSEITREVASLEASSLPDVRCPTSRASFDDDVSSLLQQQGLAPLAFKHWRADLQQLADFYFSVSQDYDVTLRMESLDSTRCPRFHVDRTHLRLLCTYHGPGTEWLTDEQVDREAQNTGAPNEDIIRFGEPSRFEPFWVGILKGDRYPGNAGHGLVHRSPPVNSTGQTRVLFCMDC